MDRNTVSALTYPPALLNNSVKLGLNSMSADWSDIAQVGVDQWLVLWKQTVSTLEPIAARLEQGKAARSAIEELSRLPENWDGYGASAISQEVRANALWFISVIEATPRGPSMPEISPCPSGTISFEWEAGRAEAYIEIGTARYSGFVATGQQQTAFFEGSADTVDPQILVLVKQAMSPNATHPASVTEVRMQAPMHA